LELFLAAVILLIPAALVVLGLVVKFIKAVYASDARLNPLLVICTVAGVIMSCLALATMAE
jgi:uncharacterized membrane protein